MSVVAVMTYGRRGLAFMLHSQIPLDETHPRPTPSGTKENGK